jgi:glycosyltransferase involved in cell wall biosynthesis
LKCLHICESIDLRHGGVSRAILDLVSAIHAKGAEVALASAEIGTRAGGFEDLPEGLLLHDLSLKKTFDSTAPALIKDSTVVHIHTPWWVSNRKIVKIARSFGKPVVLSSHGMLDDWSMLQKPLKKYVYMKLFGERLLSQCRVHCTAEAEKDQVLKRSMPFAIDVIPLVIDEKYFSRAPEPNKATVKWPFLRDTQSQKLLFLGRVDPKKGLDIAIRALALLPNAILSVAGPGEEAYVSGLKCLATEVGVADRIRWLGSVYNQDKDSLLAACDCLVVPTQQENFGLVLVEGLSMGMHVVTTRGTDIWREIQSCGGVIADRTPDAFAKAIAKCLAGADDSNGRLALQRSRLRDWLDPARTADQYIAMYQKCINSNVP